MRGRTAPECTGPMNGKKSCTMTTATTLLAEANQPLHQCSSAACLTLVQKHLAAAAQQCIAASFVACFLCADPLPGSHNSRANTLHVTKSTHMPQLSLSIPSTQHTLYTKQQLRHSSPLCHSPKLPVLDAGAASSPESAK